MSLKTSMNATNATNNVINPRDSERALYVDGNFGNASNLAKGVVSSLSSKEDSCEGADDILDAYMAYRERDKGLLACQSGI